MKTLKTIVKDYEGEKHSYHNIFLKTFFGTMKRKFY